MNDQEILDIAKPIIGRIGVTNVIVTRGDVKDPKATHGLRGLVAVERDAVSASGIGRAESITPAHVEFAANSIVHQIIRRRERIKPKRRNWDA